MSPAPIIPSNDAALIGEDRDLISGSVLRNDRGQGTLFVAAVNGLAQNTGSPLLGLYGVLRLNADGRYTYDLDNSLSAVQGLRAGTSLTETISYTISDLSGATATASLAITIVGRNDRPTLVADTATATGGGGPVIGTLLANDSDPEGDQLFVTSFRRGREIALPGAAIDGRFGALTVSADGSYRYDLRETSAGYVRLPDGATRTETFLVRVSDGYGGTSVQTLQITVVGRNDAPVAGDDAGRMNEDRDAIAGRVLRNDRDPDRDALQVSEVNGDSLGVGTAKQGAYGTLTLQANGQYLYDLANGRIEVQGLDSGETLTDVFTYTVRDPSGATDTATLAITIVGRNDRPVGVTDSFSVVPGRATVLDVLANDRDVDGETLSVASVGRARNGTVVIDGDGNVVYTPRTGFTGTDGFTYRPFDGDVLGAAVRVTVTVSANTAPDAVGESYTVRAGQVLTIGAPGVLANDTDPDGDTVVVDLITASPARGNLVLNTDGALSYTPNLGASGQDSFTYRINDGRGGFDQATVTINIVANSAPVAVDDSFTMRPGQVLTIAAPGLIANDTDADGDGLILAAVGQPTNGTVTALTDGSFVYTPNAGFTGVDRFEYEAGDGVAFSNRGTVTINVVNSAPVFAITSAPQDAVEGLPGGGSGAFIFTITRTSGDLGAAQVGFSVQGGAAPSATGNDLDNGFNTNVLVDFAEGQMTAQVEVFITPDTVDEPDEIVTIRLETSTYGTVDPTAFAVRILDDDLPPPVFAITSAPQDAAEGVPGGGSGAFIFTVSRISGDLGAAQVGFSVQGGAAPSATGNDLDNGFNTNVLVDFAEGQMTAQVEVFITPDTVDEPDETVTIRLETSTYGTVDPTAFAVRILDDDLPPPVFAITSAPQDAAEGLPGGGSGAFIFTITRTSGDLGAAQVGFSVQGGAAPSATADDLDNGFNTNVLVNFAEGQMTAQVEVFITPDTVDEPDETVTIRLETSTYGTVDPTAFAVRILDDDLPPPVFAITSAPQDAAEGVPGGGSGAFIFTITRTSGDLGAAQVGFSVQGGATPSATGNDLDNGFNTNVLVDFAEGQMTAQVEVFITPDTVDEPDETVTIRLETSTYGTVDPTAFAVRILDDDTPPEIAFAAADVGSTPEGNGVDGRLLFVLTRTGDLSQASTVLLEVTGDVTAGDAYVLGATFVGAGGPGSLGFFEVTFQPGASEAEVEVFARSDSTVEPDEEVVVTITSILSNGTISPSGAVAASGTIQNDDAIPADLSLSLTLDTPETDIPLGTDVDLLVRVTNNGPATAGGSVRLTLGDGVSFGSAPQGFDPATGIWTFGPIGDKGFAELTLNTIFGATGAPFITGEILTATAPDPDSTPGNGTANGDDDTDGVQITVFDPNPPPPPTVYRLTSTAATIPEGGTAIYTVSRTGTLDAATVTVLIAGGAVNPAGDADFPVALRVDEPTILSFFAGQTEINFFVFAVPDMFAEGTETFRVSLVDATPSGQAVQFDSAAQAIDGTILDGPPLPGERDDLWIGTPGPDTFNSRQGNDTLLGIACNDTLDGDADNDLIYGGEGDDVLSGSDGADDVYGDQDNDTLIGGRGDDALWGGDGNDRLEDTQGNNLMSGGGGNDQFFGGAGNDVLNGDDGNDTLFGGDGNNTLAGGQGTDTLRGGEDEDAFSGGGDTGTWQIDTRTSSPSVVLTGGDIINLGVSAPGPFGGVIPDLAGDVVTYSVAARDGVDTIINFLPGSDPGSDQLRIDLGGDTALVRKIGGVTLITFGSYAEGAIAISPFLGGDLVVGRDIIFTNGAPPAADLSLSASVTDTSVPFGETRSISFTVTNQGGLAGGGTVQLGDVPEIGSSFLTSGSFDAQSRLWTLPDLLPGQTTTLTLDALFNTIGPRTITAEIATATQPDPDSTPGNFATLPAEDDGVAIDFTMPTTWRVTQIRDAVEGSDSTLDIATNVFRIERFATDLPQTVINFSLRPGSGPNPVSADDVVGLGNPVQYTFQEGQTVVLVAVTAKGDSTSEADETIRLTLDSVGAGVIAPGFAQAEARLINDDAPPPVFSIAPATGIGAVITEDFTSQFPLGVLIQRTGDLSQAATVTYSVGPGVTGDSATANDLQDGFGSFTAFFAAGQAEIVALVYTNPDTTPEPFETFTVTLTNTTVGTIGGNISNEYTIANDDLGPPPPPVGPESVYFSAVSPGAGRELWVFNPALGLPPTDAPIARPVDLAQTNLGPGNGNPTEITQPGDTVFWRGENEFGTSWYAYDPGAVPQLQQLVTDVGLNAFDGTRPLEDRNLGVATGSAIFLAADGGGTDVLRVFDHDGTDIGQVTLEDSYGREGLTALGIGVGYVSTIDTLFDNLETGTAEVLFVVLPDPLAFDGWTSFGLTRTLLRSIDVSFAPDLDIRELAAISSNVTIGSYSGPATTVFFTGDYADENGVFRTGGLWRSTLSYDQSTSTWLWDGAPEFIAPSGLLSPVELAPTDLTVAETGRGETLFFFGTADDGTGGGEGRIFAATTLADGSIATTSSLAASGAAIVQGADIRDYLGGVAFSATIQNGGATEAIVNRWTDLDGDGTFTLTEVFSRSGGVIEDLVTDNLGNIAFTWDNGSEETLYVWRPDNGSGNPELVDIISRFGSLREIDELRLDGGNLVYRMDSLLAEFPALFVYDISAGAGDQINTDAFTGGTADGAVGGATLVATDFGVAFQADLGFAGVRLVTAQAGTLPAQSFNLTANFTAEGNFGPGIAFDGVWIGTGFNNATAVSGLLRADAAGGITTLYPSSPNLGAAVAGLGREVVFGETTDAVNDILIHDLDTGATRTLLADHLIGSAATIGGRIIFSALDRSDALNSDVDQSNDIWSLFKYEAGAATFLADLPNGTSGEVGDDPIVPFSDTGQSFFGQGDRIFWKQLNDAAGAGVELHSIDLAAADIPGSLALYDTAPGATSGGDFNEAVFLDGRFYFTASTDGTFGQGQLYAADGSAPPVAVTGPDLATNFAFPFNLTAVGDEFFFTATDAGTGLQRIFQLDDSGTTATRLSLPDIAGVVIELADLGDRLGVIAFEAGIDQVFVFTPGAQPGDESGATRLTSFSQTGGISSLTLGGDDEFYFTRTTASEGRELWVIDSSAPEGARLLQDINLTPLPAPYDPQQVESSWV